MLLFYIIYTCSQNYYPLAILLCIVHCYSVSIGLIRINAPKLHELRAFKFPEGAYACMHAPATQM